MIEVEHELFSLTKAIKNSNTYKEYRRRLMELKSVEGLKERVDRYRKENYNLQIMEDDGTLADRIEAFAQANMDLSEEPRVRSFLDAELALCRMLQEITDRVIDEIEFE